MLYGGTAIALRLGHRTSDDFDFFTEGALDKARILDTCASGAAFEVLQDSQEAYTLLVESAEQGRASVKLSCFGGLNFGRYGEPARAAGSRIVVAALEDLLASKLGALMMRVQSKDYRDIAALVRAGVPLARGLAIAAAMHGARFAVAECLRTLTYFEGGDLKELGTTDRETLRRATAAVAELPVVTRQSGRLGFDDEG